MTFAEEMTTTPSTEIAKNLTLDQLRELSERVQEAQAQKIFDQILALRTSYANAVRDLRHALESVGLSLEDGLAMNQARFMAHLNDYVAHQRDHPSKVINGVVPKKYQHPTNPDLTWSGRGMRPRWMVTFLKENPTATVDDLRIPHH